MNVNNAYEDSRDVDHLTDEDKAAGPVRVFNFGADNVSLLPPSKLKPYNQVHADR